MGYEVVVRWVPEDISGLHPDWVDTYCEFALEEIGKHLENRVIELGNEVLEQLVSEWHLENSTEEA